MIYHINEKGQKHGQCKGYFSLWIEGIVEIESVSES